MEQVPTSRITTHRSWHLTAICTVLGLITMLLSPVIALADEIEASYNTVDATVDSKTIAEDGTVLAYYWLVRENRQSDDPYENSCNIGGSKGTLTLTITASATIIVTTSGLTNTTTVTLDGCGTDKAKSISLKGMDTGVFTLDVTSIYDSVDGGGKYVDDANLTLNVAGEEVCGDGKDNDLDGYVDEGCDTTPPVLTLPASATYEATSSAGVTLTYEIKAEDAVDGARPVTCSPAFAATSPATYPLGATTVECSASDTKGNTATGSFTITVEDTTAPTLTVPADTTVEATSTDGAEVTYTVLVVDTVDSDVTVSCTSASGSLFPFGTTLVECTATDDAGNESTGSFNVIVDDTGLPVLTLPPDATLEATSADGAPGFFSPTAEDEIDGTVPVDCDYASGATFPLGTTTVECSATDNSGNTASGSFKITVKDTTAPDVADVEDITVEATGPNGAEVTFKTPRATDAVDVDLTVTCVPASGETFALGTTPVECSATDDEGNTGTSSFDVTVLDKTAPTLDLPEDFTVEATGAAGADVTYTATATDLVDGDVGVSCTPASGSSFGFGSTTVECSATDEAGNVSEGSFTVTVVDTTAPIVDPVDDITVEATGPDGEVVTFNAPDAFDTVDGPLTTTCAPGSGSTFLLGAPTTVTCSVTDSHGNTGSTTFDVIIADTTAPALSLPTDIVAEATGPDGAPVPFTATASDLVDGDIEPSCTPASGATFELGSTTVNCSATDAAGNTASGSFTVTVEDTTPPELNLPTGVTAEATGPDGAGVTYTATAPDLVDGLVEITCTLASGSVFALGATTVNCSAVDAAGNPASDSFTVTVQDTTAPDVVDNADIDNVEATGPTGAVVTFNNPTATDLVDSDLTVNCNPASGSTFGLGTTTVTCTSTDDYNNTGSSSFSVTVVDTTAPDLHLPSGITAEATSADGAVVTYTATAPDLVDGLVEITCTPASGSTFGLSDTTVECSATDAAGNTGTGSFTVTVEDTTAPVVSVPADKMVAAVNASGAPVNFASELSASDAVSGAPAVTCVPASGSTFALGTTTVNCAATDGAGNTGTASFTITVTDQTAPVLALPANMTVEATGPSGAAVSYSATATDNVDTSVTVNCAPVSGSTFGLGTTTVNCSAADVAGNPASGSFTVTVRDTTAPTLTLPANMTVAAMGLNGAAVSYSASANDLVDGAVGVTCTPASGATFAPGTTTVNCSASDTRGNKAEGSFKVTVAFTHKGYYQPVDMTPPNTTPVVLNTVKAGSTVPLKFEVFGVTELTDTGVVKSFSAVKVNCDASAIQTAVEEFATTGGTSLRYDTTAGQFVQNWQTPKGTAGSCYKVTTTLQDGGTIIAYFLMK